MQSERPIIYFLKTISRLSALIVVSTCVCYLYVAFENSIPTWDKPVITKNGGGELIDDDWDKVENGIHLRTGLVYAKGFKLVNATCTACHSAKLITQNRASREGWKAMINWMQETQGLADLADKEEAILDYLALHYAPEKKGRRAQLEEIEWYELSE